MNTSKLLECDNGSLYDTTRANWSDNPLRPIFSQQYRKIKNGMQLRSTLRTPYAWPGGYEVLFGTRCGACLCRKCVVDNLRQVVWAIRHGTSDGWLVDQSFTTAEIDGPLYCDSCSNEVTGYEEEVNL